MTTILDRLTNEQRKELAKAGQEHGRVLEFAQAHGLNYNSLRGAMSRQRATGTFGTSIQAPEIDAEWWDETPTHPADNVTIVGSFAPYVGKEKAGFDIGPAPKPVNIVTPPLKLQEKKWAYASDFHVCMQDDRWVERLARVGFHLDVPVLIIGGDLADFDSISAHGSDIQQHDINTIIEVSGQVLRYLKQVFERIVLCPGNHDRRLGKKLDKDISWYNVVKMMIGNMDGITTTDDDFILVNDNPGWTVGHPRHFSAKPTGGLHQVALYRKRHVIAAHNHVQGVSVVNNTYVTIDPGMMCRSDYTPYYMRSNGLSKFQEWTPGFVVVDNDVPQLFSEFLTHWSDYM